MTKKPQRPMKTMGKMAKAAGEMLAEGAVRMATGRKSTMKKSPKKSRD